MRKFWFAYKYDLLHKKLKLEALMTSQKLTLIVESSLEDAIML